MTLNVRRLFLASAALCLIFVIVLLATVRFDIKGHFEGIFLLKGKDGWKYELKDDIYVGEGSRLIYRIDFQTPHYRLFQLLNRHRPGEPYLYYEWDDMEGSGYVRNLLANGSQLLTCFGRYLDNDRDPVHGLFVGGGMPGKDAGGDNIYMNETGMAYFDGRRWYHVWCSVNEGIIAGSGKAFPPSQWKYLGSRVLDKSQTSVVITSSHEVPIDGGPLRIDRYVYLNAGDTYFVLSIKVTNLGQGPVTYSYVYGDEPWVGNYGSSAGNVGWVQDRLVIHEELLDTSRYTYAGYLDYFNPAIGERRQPTMVANFIEWFSLAQPMVYFSNTPSVLNDPTGKKIPLSSDTRYIGVEWLSQVLAPRQTNVYMLAIGMAEQDPVNGFPLKPEGKLATLRESYRDIIRQLTGK